MMETFGSNQRDLDSVQAGLGRFRNLRLGLPVATVLLGLFSLIEVQQ